MVIFFWGIFIFLFSLAVQIFVWKIHLPKRQVKTLLQIFFLTLFFLLLGLVWAGNNFPEQSNLPHTLWEFIHLGFFNALIIFCYMMTYPGIEGDSPSLAIVLAISNAGKGGLEKSILKESLNDDLLVRPRIRDMILDNMAYLKKDKYFLTPKGRFIAQIFIFYRNLLGLPKGG
jgi:hypothetical protein